MQKQHGTRQALTFILLLGFAFSLPGPLSFTPALEAASASASVRIIKKLEKQVKTLKRQLAAARAVPPLPPTPTPFIEMVPVGNAGNGPDAGNASEANVYGAVPYEYQIGKYEVTLAQYWIPSEDEWYKAAYHQPSGESGDSDNYWLYPTKSNAVPGNTIGVAPPSKHANFFNTVFSATQSVSYSDSQNYLTAVGSYPGSAGFYGTFDQGGNVYEWNDAVVNGVFRGLRGGSWGFNELNLRSSNRNFDNPDLGNLNFGFRVASP